MNFLFIYPDFLHKTRHNRNIPGNYNEGIASMSAALKGSGHTVSLYHMTYMPEKEEFISEVRGFSPGLIGLSVRTTVLDAAGEMAGWLDDEFPDIPVIAGGYHPTLAPGEVITLRGIDAICIGEGEFPVRDLVDNYAQTGVLESDVQSFWFKGADGEIKKNPIRPYLEDLDQLPFPELDLFDFRNLKSNRLHTAEVIVSRGCLYSCTYCANAQLRNVYDNKKHYARFRSPENAIELLESVVKKDPDLRILNFNDAILNMFEDWFYPFMELYKERIGLKFSCNLRFDLLDERMCNTLAECGCYLIVIGLENGNEEFRTKYLHRTMKNDHMIKVSQWLSKAGITIHTYNIVGLPHETLPLTLETIKLNAKMDVDNVVVSLFYPYPSTTLAQIAYDGGFMDPNVPANDTVRLRMPQYSRDDILYAKYSFHKLIKKYRKIFSNPDKEKAAKKEAALDKKILSPLYPRALIRRCTSAKHNITVWVKRVAARVLPKVYEKLRNNKYKSLKSA
jgi:radical SAM superfamily enzyme YgiQ (UPF0313 family)